MKDKLQGLIAEKKKTAIIAVVVVLVIVLGGVGGFILFSGGEDDYEDEIDISVPHFIVTPAPPGISPND